MIEVTIFVPSLKKVDPNRAEQHGCKQAGNDPQEAVMVINVI